MIRLRKIKPSDKKHFLKWWRDVSLLKLTSGNLKRISDQEADEYFAALLNKGTIDRHYIITKNGVAIGHIALEHRKDNWYETQIVIGEKREQNKGYGTRAIQQLLHKAKRDGINKIYLEVRPNNMRAIQVYERVGFKKDMIKHYPNNKYLRRVVRMVLEN